MSLVNLTLTLSSRENNRKDQVNVCLNNVVTSESAVQSIYLGHHPSRITGELFSQLVQCAESGRPSSRPLALAVVRNLASLPANRPRFLTTKSVLTMVGEKILAGSPEEKRDAALITWALAANHQKAKVALRGLGLVGRLQLAAATSDDEIFSFVSELLQTR
ncbi:hypothetical protein J6590_083849 [Homalodisca vitripennis]|nr:hypothetical protein J6590_083849 [Homalodisca vitripennis]